MTNKVQKIKDWISGAYHILSNLDTYIDSLQEEPNTYKLKFNVGDTIKAKDGYEVTIESIGDDCYFVDRTQACIKFSTQDQWELVEEPLSEDLEEAAKHYLYSNILYDDVYVGEPTDKDCIEMFKAGAKWQKEQMMAKATDMVVGYWMPNGLMLTVDEAENCYNIDEGDRVKVIVIKEN